MEPKERAEILFQAHYEVIKASSYGLGLLNDKRSRDRAKQNAVLETYKELRKIVEATSKHLQITQKPTFAMYVAYWDSVKKEIEKIEG